jgi:hypothetical protein
VELQGQENSNVKIIKVSVLVNRFLGPVARMGEGRNACKILVVTAKYKTPLGGLGFRLVDNIRMDLKDIEYEGSDWIRVAQDRDQGRAAVNMVMNLQFP